MMPMVYKTTDKDILEHSLCQVYCNLADRDDDSVSKHILKMKDILSKDPQGKR